MEALRRYVFPVIWMLIIGVIALSVARMAFFSDAEASEENPVTPGGSVDLYATVAADTGDISSSLSLDATVSADAGTAVTSKSTGTITKIWVADGDTIGSGDRILQVRVVVEPEPVAAPEIGEGEGEDADGTGDGTGSTGSTGTSGTTGTTDAPVEYRYLNLTAPRGGIVRDLAVKEWEDIAEDAAVATISPGTFSVVAALTPEQQLSLLDVDIQATVQIPALDAPVACRSVAVEDESGAAPSDDSTTGTTGDSGTTGTTDVGADEYEYDEWGDPVAGDVGIVEGSGSGEGSAELRCPLPGDTRVVDGLKGTIDIDMGSVEGVVTVPTTAVEGEGSVGVVYVLDEATGEPMPLDVTLGLRGDGIVEIVDGLEVGQEILQFVPGVDNDDMMGVEVW
ncbi:HlyD family efflux transporter periplasmic adaptor subunit [Brachybacterium sp. DNPG3]